MKFTKILLIFILVITTIPYFTPSKIQAEEITHQSTQSYDKASTNQLTKELKLTVEKLSDVEVVVKGPNDVIPDSVKNLRTRADSNGKANITIPLGTKVDNPNLCHPEFISGSYNQEIPDQARDDNCEDGEYTVQITSIDAAGNRSESTVIKIIRDTIAPNTPEVSEIYICGANLCIDLTGEEGTEILINGQPTNVIASSQGVTLSLVEGYQSNG